jgi:hypothetical protein
MFFSEYFSGRSLDFIKGLAPGKEVYLFEIQAGDHPQWMKVLVGGVLLLNCRWEMQSPTTAAVVVTIECAVSGRDLKENVLLFGGSLHEDLAHCFDLQRSISNTPVVELDNEGRRFECLDCGCEFEGLGHYEEHLVPGVPPKGQLTLDEQVRPGGEWNPL